MHNNHCNCSCCCNHFEYCTPMYNLYSWNTKYPTYCTANTNNNVKPGTSDIAEALAGKQDKLVSGTNIKTINGQSLLGEGNIVISGGSGGSASPITVTQLGNHAVRINFN